MPPARKRATRTQAGSKADPAAVLKAASGGTPPPVLVFTGSDSFSRDAILRELGRSLVGEGLEAFNLAVLPGDGLSGDDLVRQAEILPMAGSHRFITGSRAEKIRQKDAEIIAAYAESPCASTCLAFVCEEAKGPLVTALKKAAVRLDFPAPRDYQLSRWLEAQARRLKIPLEADGARALADLMGDDYIGAMSELERAALSVAGTRKRISRRIVEDLASRGRDTNPFHLSDQILGRQPALAVATLRDLHDSGVSSLQVLGMIEAQLRRFLDLRARVDRGEPARSVIQSRSPTLPPAVKYRLTAQLEHFDEPRLVEAFRIARRTDRALKSHGSGDDLAHMEALIWRICGL